MDKFLKYRVDWLARVFVSLFLLQNSIITVSANLIGYELEYHSYSSFESKFKEEKNSFTNRNLKDAVTVVCFTCNNQQNLVDYRK